MKDVARLWITLLIVAISLAISKLWSSVPGPVAFAAIGYSTVFALAVCFTALAFRYSTEKAEWAARLAQMDARISALSGLVRAGWPAWLKTCMDLMPEEKNTPYKEVWVVSPDLSNDVYGPTTQIRGLLEENARRDVTYTYFVPRSREVESVLPALKSIFAPWPNRLRVVWLRENEWHARFVAHVLVLNPQSEHDSPPKAYFELPLAETGRGCGHWVPVAEPTSKRLVGTLRGLLEAHPPEFPCRDS